jgi:hypothetical protein
VAGCFKRNQPDVEPRVFRALESSLNMMRITSAREIAITFLAIVIAGLTRIVAAQRFVVPAQAGTHNHRGHDFAGCFRESLTPSASLPSVCMGPRLREDDGGVCAGASPKSLDSNFKQPRLLVLAPPRELGFYLFSPRQ